MSKPMTNRAHARAVLRLGLPLIGSHVAQFAVTMTDTLMLGWYDVGELAAQVLAGSVFFILFLVGSGFAWATTPMISETAARGDLTQVRRVTRMGLWLSMMAGAAAMPVFLLAGRSWPHWGRNPRCPGWPGNIWRSRAGRSSRRFL